MILGLIGIALIVLITAVWAYVEDDWEFALFAGGLALVVWLGAWVVFAWPYSSYQKDVCQQRAEGYGLERSQWSVRHDCRVYLPGGELVPENRIRITTDGQIIVTDDE